MQDYLEWKRSTTKNPDTPENYERWAETLINAQEALLKSGRLYLDDITTLSGGSRFS